ncbi:Histidine--tRNA ligase [Geodia barretti]|uniref:histidine--tRNA ligase n=1 Tax=Geodia barretti TaxID=519541 RepID=A0AA35QU22_GEOBA|nr:Histidine--tRNA ligase [Geodia barretti]
MGSRGYQPIDTPLLEETELFVRKSGGDLAGRLYNFTDPGGTSVSLRPEFTSSVIRHYIDNEESLSLPLRWQYSGPVFRYSPAEQGSYRQFTQSGAELVGATSEDADIEIISLAVSGLHEIGLDGFRLRLGHLGVLHSLLDEFVSKEGKSDVAGLMERAGEVGLLSGSVDLGIGLETALESMSTEAAEEFVLGVLKESMPEPVGRRTTDQIVARLLSKVRQANCPDAFERALNFVRTLSGLCGEPQATLQAARAAADESGVDAAPLDEIGALLERAHSIDIGCGISESRVSLDMGMARGISYYTGVIFELVAGDDGTAALGGGGRYDGLVQALGGSEGVPAMGFAYNVNELLDALLDSGISSIRAQGNGVQTNGV